MLGTRPPREAEAIKRALDNMSVAVGAYVGGAILQSLIAGVVTFIVLSILGVPAPLALAVMVAVLDLIPLVGATLGAFLVAIVTLFVDFPTVTIIWVDLGDRLPAVRELRDPAADPEPRRPARPVRDRRRGDLRRHAARDRRRPRWRSRSPRAAQIGVREFMLYRKEALLAQQAEDEAAAEASELPPGDGPPGGGEPPAAAGEPAPA